MKKESAYVNFVNFISKISQAAGDNFLWSVFSHSWIRPTRENQLPSLGHVMITRSDKTPDLLT